MSAPSVTVHSKDVLLCVKTLLGYINVRFSPLKQKIKEGGVVEIAVCEAATGQLGSDAHLDDGETTSTQSRPGLTIAISVGASAMAG